MILNKEDKKIKMLEVDLTRREGNAHYLLSLAESLGKQLGFNKHIIKDIQATMMMGSYEQLIETFDIWFGDHVILYK